jgi:hypothetical protein
MSNDFQGIQQSLAQAGEKVAELSPTIVKGQQVLTEVNAVGKTLKNSRTAVLPIILPDIIFDTINSGVEAYTNVSAVFGPRYELFRTKLIQETTQTQNGIVGVTHILETTDDNQSLPSDINGMMAELKCNSATREEISRKTIGYNKAGDAVVTVSWKCLTLTPVNAPNTIDSGIEKIEQAVASAKKQIHAPTMPAIPSISLTGIVHALLPDIPSFPLEKPTEADVTEYIENKILVLKRKQQYAVIEKNKMDVEKSKTPFTLMNEQIAAGNRINNNRG